MLQRRLLAAALACAPLAWAGSARADEPPASREDDASSLRVPLLIAGPIIWGVSYGVPLGIAASHGLRDRGGWFLAPVVGPFAYLATRRGCGPTSDSFTGTTCAFGDTMLTIVAVTDGLLQAGGVALAVTGLLLPSGKAADRRATGPRPFLAPLDRGAAVGVTFTM